MTEATRCEMDPVEREAAMIHQELAALQHRVFEALYPPPGQAMLGGGDLLSHAHRELVLAGLFDADSDGGGALGKDAWELIRVFYAQGHSGGSAGVVLDVFTRLASYHTLTSNDHRVSRDVSEYCGKPMLQDVRDSRYFSEDGGQTWSRVEVGG